MSLHVWTDLAPSRQAQAILTATMLDVGIRCVDLRLVALPTALYLQRYLVSFVRGKYVLRLCWQCCRFHRQESGLRRCDLKIEVARDFYVSKQRISTFWGVRRLLGCSRRAPSAALRLLTVRLRMNCIASRKQTFASYLILSLKLSVLPLHADLPWKVLVVSNHALLKSFLQRKKQSLPDVRLNVGSSTDRWIRKC